MSPQLESLTVEVKDNVAQVTLIGPGKGNAMGPEFWAEMPVVFAELDADPEVRAIVLTGSGNNFCFGLNLLTMGNTLSDTMANEVSAKPRTDFHTHLKHLQHSISAVADCRTPTIASIHGWCIGGGVDLVTACDIRICSSEAYFTIQEINVGIVADVGTLQRIPHLLPQGLIRELAYTGRKFPAAEALRYGFVNRVEDTHADALAAAEVMAREICAKSPLAITGIKQVLNYGREHSISDGLEYVAVWNAGMLQGEDMKEAVSAFFQKRKPHYTGR
jgi:enoyl-CoA hydratase